MPTLKSADLEMHYEVDDFTDPWTKPETILMLHGNSESGLAWYGWVPLLARKYRVVRPDMRGFGDSTPMPRDFAWTLDVVIDDYVRLMDALGVDRFHLVGAKIGGTVAMRSRFGEGATWTVVIPSAQRRFPVHKLIVRGTTVPFAIPADWTITTAESSDGAIDLIEELGLGPPHANPLVLQLSRGDTSVRIAVAAAPQDAEARWLVTTSADTLAGVASIDNVECLVLKPELLVHTSGKVAVIDDSEIVREMVAFTLEPYGIEVALFEQLEPVSGTLAVKPVDIVLLDLSFKGMDIAATVQRLKQTLPTVEVYLHSDRTPVELARLAEQAKADGHIAKAAGRDQFVARVLRILRTKRST